MFYFILIALLLIIPLWKIFERVALPPMLSLLALIPMIGLLLALGILAYSQWNPQKGDAL